MPNGLRRLKRLRRHPHDFRRHHGLPRPRSWPASFAPRGVVFLAARLRGAEHLGQRGALRKCKYHRAFRVWAPPPGIPRQHRGVRLLVQHVCSTSTARARYWCSTSTVDCQCIASTVPVWYQCSTRTVAVAYPCSPITTAAAVEQCQCGASAVLFRCEHGASSVCKRSIVQVQCQPQCSAAQCQWRATVAQATHESLRLASIAR